MKNIAIIPARSGSKGLKDKNIKLLKGKPLLVYSIEAAQKSGIFDEIMVSTDSQIYADIALQYGAKVPFLRSMEQSSDNAGSWDVVKEVLKRYINLGRRFDTVCLLQPTSPLRSANDIVMAYSELANKKADAITSVCEVDHSPLWNMTLSEDLSLSEFRRNLNVNIPRQKLQQYYRINGAIYIRKILYDSNENISIGDRNEYAMVMEKSRSVDIDTQFDFEFAEYLLEKNDKDIG